MNKILLPMAFAALLSGMLTILLTPLVRKAAFAAKAVREPRSRDSHEQAMPLWGGLAIFCGFVASVLLLLPLIQHQVAIAVGKGEHPILGILVGAAVVAVVGLLDDKYDLPPLAQMVALLLGGFVAAKLGARIDGISNPFAPIATGEHYTSHNYIPLGMWAIPLTMLWYFVATKTFDFMDGLDGLASGVCAIAAGAMGLIAAVRGEGAVALLAAALAGACIGFLRHNYNPASIFMGSIGSFFLGFVLAGLAVVGTTKIPTIFAVLVPLLALGVPIFDGFYVALRRLVSGKNPLAADKTHIHHRLRDRGMSVKDAVVTIYFLTAAGCLAAVILAIVLIKSPH